MVTASFHQSLIPCDSTGSITHYLSEDVLEKVVSDRLNVEQEVLDKHYDKRIQEQKVEQRREHLEGI